MANGFADALGKFGRGFALGMAPADMRASVLAERERERQMEAMNPIREAVLSELLGPRNTFEGAPSSPPGGFMGQVDTGTAEGQATPQALPVEPQVRALPPELTPPPEIDAVLHDAAARFGVPVNALRAIAAQESSFNPAAVNKPTAGDPTDPGAVGLFQFIDETARGMGIDPRDPVQSSMAAAQMLRQELDKGASIEEAMTAHFGGPNREEWGPNTQRYMRMVTDKFQRLEGGAGTTGAISTAQTTAPAPAQEAGAGPFGTQVQEPQQQGDFGRRLLEEAARDPQAFAQMFADGGVEQIASLLQGGQGFTGTLSEGQVAFQGGQPVAAVPKAGGAKSSTRVVSGDTQEGQQLGIPPGERARVEYEFNNNGNIINRNVKGRFGSGQTINIGPQGERLGVDVFNKEIETIAEDGRIAMNMLPALDRAGELLTQDVQTGLGQQLVLPIRQLAEDFNVPLQETAQALGINLSELSSQEEFRRLTTQVIIDGFAKFKGNLNREEVKLAQDAFANFGTSEEANRRAVAMTRAAAEQSVERRNKILGARTQQQVTEAMKWQQGSAEELKQRTEELFRQMGGGQEARREPSTQQEAAGGPPPDIQSAVPQGMVLGPQTADGRWEVLDSNGNVVGHIEP